MRLFIPLTRSEVKHQQAGKSAQHPQALEEDAHVFRGADVGVPPVEGGVAEEEPGAREDAGDDRDGANARVGAASYA